MSNTKNLEELKTSISNYIRDDNFNIKSLEKLLAPVAFYADNAIFRMHISDILTIIIKDRDNDNKLTANDIVLFSKDIVAMTSFVTSIILILNSLPGTKIKYDETETSLLMFKIIVYIFLVIVPSKTSIKYTLDEKIAISNTCLLIHEFLINSQILKSVVNGVREWFKSKGYCQCTTAKTPVIEEKMPEIKRELISAVNSARTTEDIMSGINELKVRLSRNVL